MNILIVDDAEQMPATLRSLISDSSTRKTDSSQSGIFAALSLPQIVSSQLAHITRPKGSAMTPTGTGFPDFASLQLENSPELTATLLNALGLAYLANGRLHEAQCFIEQGLEVRLKLFGSEHPQTAASMNSLARVLRDAGQLEAALVKIQLAMSVDARTTGADSLASAGDLAVLASIQFQRSELTEAEHAALAAQNIFETKLQGSDPWVPYLLDILARVHQWRSDYGKASELYRRASELDARLYGCEHPIYAVRVHNHATVLQAQGKLVEAKQKYDETIAILAKSSGEWHPNLIDALGNRGTLRLAQQDFDGARADFEDALTRNRKVRGSDHAFVGYDLLNLAQLSFDQQELDEALGGLEEALAIFRAKLPANHAYIAAALTLQGRSLVEAERASDAEAPLEEAVGIWLAEFGERSVEHAIARATLARAWFLQDKHLNELQAILQSALATVVAVRGVDHRTAQTIRDWLKDVPSGGKC